MERCCCCWVVGGVVVVMEVAVVGRVEAGEDGTEGAVQKVEVEEMVESMDGV